MPMRPIARAGLVCLLLAVSGCGPIGAPPFRLNIEGREPAEISLAQVDEITAALEKLFGTPDRPVVPPRTGLRLDRLRMAAGPIGVDQQGNDRGLYRQHCASCHGLSGDGAGPTAAVQNPYPRDFRQGVYKFTSTAGGAKPFSGSDRQMGDLERVLRNGLPGTAMPSFANLSDDDIEALLQYVRYLSIRGETELLLAEMVVDRDEYPVDAETVVEEVLLPVVDMWAAAADMALPQAEAQRSRAAIDTDRQLTASIARGFKLYSSKNAQCTQCHGPDGRGDGEQAELYDDRNDRKKGATPEQTAQRARLFQLPIQRLKARNYTQGIFHGGDRPIDLYWRIHTGLKGTPMPAAGPMPGVDGVLKPEEIWDVVNYVRSRAAGG